MSERACFYDYCVRGLEAAVDFWETTQADRPPGRDEIVDPETGKRWNCSGLFVGPAPDREDMLAMLVAWGESDGDCVTCSVRDDGEYGDGLWLSIQPRARAGTRETHPDRWGDYESEEHPREFLSLRLTPEQARVLAEALLAAVRLREASKERP